MLANPEKLADKKTVINYALPAWPVTTGCVAVVEGKGVANVDVERREISGTLA